MSTSFARLHPAIQRALWDLQWESLRPLQSDAIEAFAEGSGDLILSAATASGKTEAAFLPVLSAIADDAQGSVRAIYVGPLKALINDQFQRLEILCQHADIPVHRWHGDVSATDKEKLRSEPGGVLLITPESLESAFINYGNRLGRIFSRLSYVVIDELHSFIGDVRGTHLRSLLMRLAQTIGSRPRLLGLSATLADFSGAQRFLNASAPDSVQVIKDPAPTRTVRIGLRAYPQPKPKPAEDEAPNPEKQKRLAANTREASEDLAALAAGVVPSRWSLPATIDDESSLETISHYLAEVFREKTNLIFINSRGIGEMLADEINEISLRERWPRNPFLLHHGSLSKEIREEVEERLKSGEPLSAFCTSTLEMGIDIGNVYSVGQLGPPWSVASLVQRLGRSGRREGEISILRLFSLDPPPGPDSKPDELLCPQLLRSMAMVNLLVGKWLEPADDATLPLSTLVHQILSILRQTGGCKVQDLRERLLVKGAFQDVSTDHFKALLKSLLEKDLIEQLPSLDVILSPKGERITHSKDFYAAFQGNTEYAVRHGQLDIGKLPITSLPPLGENFLLNGRRWRVEEIDDKAQVIEVAPASGRKAPVFVGAEGLVHRRVAEEMAAILRDNTVPRYLHEDASALLQSARAYAIKNGVFERPWLERSRECYLFPWTGSKGLETLRVFAKADGIEANVKKHALSYHCTPENLRTHLEKVAAGGFQVSDHASLANQRLVEKYDEYIPENLLDSINSTRLLNQEDAMSAAREALSR